MKSNSDKCHVILKSDDVAEIQVGDSVCMHFLCMYI